MENDKTVTIKLTKSEFGKLWGAYLRYLDDVLESPHLSDEDKRLEIEDLQSVGLALWSALPAFVPVYSLRSLREIDWWFDDEQKA
ncbi:MAG: hypothetical protein DYH15_07925 [Nitrosomonas sp. PRO4]|nr:hypothetical protein [Nitrosomonas sp. PRO4]